jgi:DNA repair protein RadC
MTTTKYRIPKYKCRLVRDGGTSMPSAASFAQAEQVLFKLLANLPHEELHVLFLDGQNKIVGSACVSQGGLHGCAVSSREVFRPAIVAGASAIILSHNHPSGDPTPSSEDILMTKAIVSCGEMLGIPVLDHIVVCPEAGRSRSIIDAI